MSQHDELTATLRALYTPFPTDAAGIAHAVKEATAAIENSDPAANLPLTINGLTYHLPAPIWAHIVALRMTLERATDQLLDWR